MIIKFSILSAVLDSDDTLCQYLNFSAYHHD